MAEKGKNPPVGMTVSVVGTIYCAPPCGMHLNVTSEERDGRTVWVAVCLNPACDAYKHRYSVLWPKAELALRVE
jgi:hypothetical protein